MKVTRKKHLSKAWFLALVLGVAGYSLPMGTSFAQVFNVIVNCPGDSIQAAIDGAAPGPLTIVVNGICIENVLIVRDQVNLAGPAGGGVTGLTAGAAITIAARLVGIDGLTVSGGGGAGIGLFENASATIQNSTIQGNAGSGVEIRNGSFVRLRNNTISLNGICDVLISDSGTAEMRDTTIVSNQADRNRCAGLGVYRDAFVRMFGANSIINTTVTGLAIEVAYNSTLRQQSGHSTVSGEILGRDKAHVEFRDVAITGDVNVLRDSGLRFQDQGTVQNNVTVTGNININETNLAHFSSTRPVTVNGAINCNGGTLFGSPIVAGGTGVNCPAPLHVLRTDGSAKVLAEDDQVPANPAAPQVMFELRRPGAVRFDLVDENNGTTWVFQNRNDAFDITKAGTGVQEFKLGGNGNLTVLGTATAAAHLTASDRNLKENFVDLEGTQVLAKLTTLPVTEWSFKGDPGRHIGPTAQDFKAAFGLGGDDTHIASLDVASVAVVGVKQLHKMIAARDATITHQQTEITALKQRLAALEGMVSRLVAQQPMQTAQR